MNLQICPRCHLQGLEELETHSHCIACGFSPTASEDLDQWRRLEYRRPRISRGRPQHDSDLSDGGLSIPRHFLVGRVL